MKSIGLSLLTVGVCVAAKGPFQFDLTNIVANSPFIPNNGAVVDAGQGVQRFLNNLGARPFQLTLNPLLSGQNVAGDAEDAGAAPAAVYETNERGQFLTLESYAKAMSDQLGIPLPVARRMAELNRSFGRQLIMLNNAVSDWISTVEEKMPAPGSLGEPIVAGLDAATAAAQNPNVQAAMPVVTGMVDMMLTGLSTAFRVPTDAFLEAPKNEMQNINELVHALSPVALDDVPSPRQAKKNAKPANDENTQQ